MQLRQYIRKSDFVSHIHPTVVKFSILSILSLTLLVGLLGLYTPQAHAQASAQQSVSSSQVVGMINQVFGPYAAQAISLARCESSLNPGATNVTSIGGSHAAGLFQILYPSTWYTTSQAGRSPYDPAANIQAAYDIFARDGHSWREWACRP